MAQQTVNIGSTANDGTGDPLRTAFDKLNDNDTELYAAVAGKQASDATLTAVAALSWSSGVQVPVMTAADTFALRTLGVAASTDILTRADGDTRFAAASHTHAASDIASGTIATARLGSGTANNTTFLRGDGVWATPSGSGTYTDEEAQDAVGGILTDSAEIDFTYNDGAPSITASLIAGSIALSKLANISTARLLGRSTAGSGTIEELTVGSGLSLSGGTLSATGGSGMPSQILFGDGTDGAFSSDGSASAPAWATKSGSVYTMTRDADLTDLTLSGTAQIVTNGFILRASGTVDLTAAAAGAIQANGGNGGNGAGAGTAGSAGSAGTERTVGTAAGTTVGATGTSGAGAQAAAPTNTTAYGGAGGASGAGGSGSAGAGGASRNGATATVYASLYRPMATPPYIGNHVRGGAAGGGGASGAGNSTNNGGGGGGGATGGAVAWLFFHTINRGAGTAAAAIQAIGGTGGNGGSPTGGSSNYGGGGGAGGGGGGLVYLCYNTLSGSSKSGAIDASGGVGGNGGNGGGTGTGGNGGTGGAGGQIILVNASTGAVTVTDGRSTTGTAGSAASGTSGGSGGAGGACTAAL